MIFIPQISKGHNSVKKESGVEVLVCCTSDESVMYKVS